MSNAARCDQCGVFAKVEGRSPYGDPYRPKVLPDGWLSVYVRVAPNDPVTTADLEYEVCGWACAATRMTRAAVALHTPSHAKPTST